MYSDEFRSYQKMRSLRIAEAVSDPEGLYVKLNELSGKSRQREMLKMEKERQDLKRRVSAAHRKIKQLQKENSDLKRERELAKDRLEKLRKSRTMRAGRAVTSPARFGRSFAKNPKKASSDAAKKFNKTWEKLRSTLTAAQLKSFAPAQPTKSDKAAQTARKAEAKTQTFKPAMNLTPAEAFARDKSAGTLERLMNHKWYIEGAITETAALLSENADLRGEMSEKGQILAVRIMGAASLNVDQLLPARSKGAAYVVEPRRVMYCVHQTPVYNSNGYSTRTRGVAKGLKAAGCDVVVVGRAGYPWDSKADVKKPKELRNSVEMDGVDYVHLPGGNLNRDPFDLFVLECADALVREARIQRPRVIQSASNFRTALPALIAARRVGVPFVYEVRGLWEFTEVAAKPHFKDTERFNLMRDLETFVAQNADVVLAITRQVEQELVARGVPADKIVVAPNAVDQDVFLPLPRDVDYAKSKRISTEVPIIGFAGSMVEYEGLHLLLEASSRLQQRGIGHQIVFAGSGAAEKSLKEQARDFELGDWVRFLGRLPQEEMPRLQSTFDIVCCPRLSTIVTELVSPLKPLESFATSKATVLSDVAPNVDLAGEGNSRALLFEADNVEALERALEKVIVDDDLRADLGRTARLWAVTERSWTSIGAIMEQAHKKAELSYEEATANSRSLRELHVGVIGDEFTRTTLQSAFDVELLDRERWSDQLSNDRQFDLIFVESAWEGNEGQWSRGIGHYSDEESADLRGLLNLAKELGVPTVFWNKEDPVHFVRFAPNAALFDHVFTTDANVIPRYHATPGQVNRTISALPFYAQPEIHNPLPTDRPFHESIAYAGTYYGDRYKERSKGLEMLLEAASRYPLDIYDRQAKNPDSPYKFPLKYQPSVRGALPYSEVIKSYRTHLVHLNVNSVLNSPTMFSRRVVEIPACGGLVLSPYGRGITETLGSNVACSNRDDDHRAWLYDWTSNPLGRLEEIWRQMRTIYRSHTTETALAILARTAGVPVSGLHLAQYVARLELVDCDATTRDEIITALLSQSRLPLAVLSNTLNDADRAQIEAAGIRVVDSLEEAETLSDNLFEVAFAQPAARTFAEDVLLPTRFGDYEEIHVRDGESFAISDPTIELLGDAEAAGRSSDGIVARRIGDQSLGYPRVVVTLPVEQDIEFWNDADSPAATRTTHQTDETSAADAFHGKKVVIAGHDLKFAQGILAALHDAGAEVLIDHWESHSKHDEAHSLELLKQADVVLCEWGLGNAVWYSQNVREDQRLVVRVHSQELFRPYLKQTFVENVDTFIFVGELIRAAAVTSHGIPPEKTVIIPNPVDIESLAIPKEPGVEKTIGFVGIVPRSKRLDRALDVLEDLLNRDPEFVLRIKGKTPEDYPWMKNRPEEMRFYEQQYRRIDEINARFPGAVVFDGFSPNMAEWYSKVGIVLSTSEFESFHLTIADGAASGALPLALNWPGADRIYPTAWLAGTSSDIAERIIETVTNSSSEIVSNQFMATVERFDKKRVLSAVLAVLGG
nr:glycosyltransferase [Corynebacterium sp. HMSC059E07]